ncbi:hypothetical protein CWE08_04130 [Aliidiomarina iranensis]|uniref:Urease accessory protein UreH-like transmembrane domain-containing protein n=1 Tax=Aliidiomarina iranensis TaxID=1434071 RepID=A0A432W036_9GAMM|nr:sulfite exporter TauE/SafE family protein [Aliidiomarina iranensis]RUO22377.1 hypothetical protein CWE08_04130 [Aliidiomarina iranensis]
MNIDVVAALVMGLAGSGHCLAMCGGLAAAMGYQRSPMRLFWYNLGRIISYAIAGFIVAAAFFSISKVHANGLVYLRILAGIMMVLLGLYLFRWNRALLWLEKAGSYLWRYIQPLTQKLPAQKTSGYVFLAGMLWGWLPCGLVYSALTWAALSGDPFSGAGFMLLFGLGTFPAMFLTGVFSQKLATVLQSSSFRWIAGLLLIGYGIATLFIAAKQL